MKRKPYRPNPYLIHSKVPAITTGGLSRRPINYANAGYWFLAFIGLVAAGFYSTYLSKITQTSSVVVHVHFALMALWIAMLIAQPLLIKYRKPAIHRLVGRLSYGLVPLTLLSGFLMLRYAYYHFIEEANQKAAAQGLAPFTADELRQQAATYVAVVVFWLAMFALLYMLAVINRKKTAVHARYMVAAALALLGPTVDRIVVFVFGLEKLPAGLPIEIIAFFVANMVLAILLWNDYRDKRPTTTLRNSLLIYLLGQTLYFMLPQTSIWGYIMAFMMYPAP